MIDALHVLPIGPESRKKVGHDYETAGFTGPDRGKCIIEGCTAKPHTICWSCSKDTINILEKYVKKVSCYKKGFFLTPPPKPPFFENRPFNVFNGHDIFS